MKLWTVQNRCFARDCTGELGLADWGHTPQNWRGFYRWMAGEWNSRIGIGEMNTPIWCWHSFNGRRFASPTVSTFALLMGDWDYYASQMLVLQLDVPDQFPLLSSYFRWNAAVECAMVRGLESIDGVAFADMFDEPLIRHLTDDIQAVVPKIDRNWITEVWSLPTGHSAGLDWEMPIEKFPRTAKCLIPFK